jgi:hypothetical protein
MLQPVKASFSYKCPFAYKPNFDRLVTTFAAEGAAAAAAHGKLQTTQQQQALIVQRLSTLLLANENLQRQLGK